jgi:hypothetical protein
MIMKTAGNHSLAIIREKALHGVAILPEVGTCSLKLHASWFGGNQNSMQTRLHALKAASAHARASRARINKCTAICQLGGTKMICFYAHLTFPKQQWSAKKIIVDIGDSSLDWGTRLSGEETEPYKPLHLPIRLKGDRDWTPISANRGHEQEIAKGVSTRVHSWTCSLPLSRILMSLPQWPTINVSLVLRMVSCLCLR